MFFKQRITNFRAKRLFQKHSKRRDKTKIIRTLNTKQEGDKITFILVTFAHTYAQKISGTFIRANKDGIDFKGNDGRKYHTTLGNILAVK